MSKPVLTVERLKEVLRYDAESGHFFRINSTSNVRAGSRAGSIGTGQYRSIRIDGVTHKEHRLAWLYVYGQWPTLDIDHINGVSGDNRIANLREANDSQNAQNRRNSKRVKDGLLGVYQTRKGTYVAKISSGKKLIHLGTFINIDEAKEASMAARRERYEFCEVAKQAPISNRPPKTRVTPRLGKSGIRGIKRHKQGWQVDHKGSYVGFSTTIDGAIELQRKYSNA